MGEAVATLAELPTLDESGELRAELLTLRADAVTRQLRSEAERTGGAGGRSGEASTETFAYYLHLGEALENAGCLAEAAAALEKAGVLGQGEAAAKAKAKALRLRAWKA